jgi:hypothetical protein
LPEEQPEIPKGRASATLPASPSFKNSFRVGFAKLVIRIGLRLS